MPNYTSNLSDEVTEAKANSLAEEASVQEVHLATEGDKNVDWSRNQSRKNLASWLEQTVPVESKVPLYLV